MSDERKGYTDEQKAAIKLRRDERNAAVKSLLALVIANDTVTEEMKELAVLAQPKAGGTGTGTKKATIANRVIELFTKDDVYSEIEVFQNLEGIGRSDMAKATKAILKNSKPEDRMWIKFDPADGVYSLEGTGADAPEGWTGYIPPVAEDNEDADEEVV